MALTALEIKGITCPDDKKQIKIFDTNGLFLLVKSGGSKPWRMRFKYALKHQEIALGKYPSITLTEARKLTIEAKILISQGINPSEERRQRKRASNAKDLAFKVVALKWWQQQKDSWAGDHAKRVKRWITKDSKSIANIAVDQIDAGHITELTLSLEASGSPKKASVILSVINRIFGCALAHRLTRTNPAQGLPLATSLNRCQKLSTAPQ